MGTVMEIGRAHRNGWPRHVAIHEAAHAVAAWYSGVQDVEIAKAGDDRVAKTRMAGDVTDCVAVAVWNNCGSRGARDGSPRIQSEADKGAIRDATIWRMIISLAGVVAQSKLTGDDVGKLLKTSGASDMRDVIRDIEIFRSTGASDAECDGAYSASMARCETLVSNKWWDIIALAKILENTAGMPATQFRYVMSLIDGPIPKPLSLRDIDSMAEVKPQCA